MQVVRSQWLSLDLAKRIYNNSKQLDLNLVTDCFCIEILHLFSFYASRILTLFFGTLFIGG